MSKGKSFADFQVATDRVEQWRTRIKAILKSLGNGWEYELEFARRSRVGPREMPRFREEFPKYCFQINDPAGHGRMRTVWCGTPAFAKKLKAQYEKIHR